MTCCTHDINCSIIDNAESRAQDFIKHGDIDRAIEIYQDLESSSARILVILGGLYAEKKGDYNLAEYYFQNALRIQEENGDDTSSTLYKLGAICQNLHEYDQALIYHFRALTIQQLAKKPDQMSIACCFLGIANAYWGLEKLSEALTYAQEALTINESIQSGNDLNIASNTAILANIYYQYGDDIQALELSRRALVLFENCTSSESVIITTLLNNIGTIEVNIGLYDIALVTFIRALNIVRRILPDGHPKRIVIENNLHRWREMQQLNQIHSYSYLWDYLPKILLGL